MTVDFPDYDQKQNYSAAMKQNRKPKILHNDSEDLLSPQCPYAF